MFVFNRVILAVALFCSGAAFAQNKVVVVPFFGNDSSHEHPDIEYVNLSAAAFQPIANGDFYRHTNGLLTAGDDSFSYNAFVANLLVPNGITFQTLTAIYRDGDAAGDVLVRLFISNYSDFTEIALAGVESTGLSFGFPFSKRSDTDIGLVDGQHPVDNVDYGYYVWVALRNGAALRGVTIGYTTGID